MVTPTGSATSSTEMTPLEQRLGYGFADAGLLELALRHRSYGGADNERLEFLGDSVIGLVISGHLYERFPGASEGALTVMRAALVRRDSLVEIARSLVLESHVALGKGVRTDTDAGDSLLADAFESVCGAIYLDGGFDAARTAILALFAEPLAHVDPMQVKDPKTRLQERLQRDGFALPEYRILAREGPDHRPQFRVECTLPELNRSARASGSSRRAAEQAAAEHLLAELEPGHD